MKIKFAFLMSLLMACHSSQESETKWLTGAQVARGHEDLSRMGVDIANNTLAQEFNRRLFPEITVGANAYFSTNPLVRGNYETDFPSAKMRAWVGAGDADWHNSPNLQHLHSLRDYQNDIPLSKQEACQESRKAIAKAALEGVNLIRRGDQNGGFYWLGHATHILQDSFSPAHSLRDGENGNAIKDICTYGKSFEAICYHGKLDLQDTIWRDSLSCKLNPGNRSGDCLKVEAKWAVNATGEFLANMGRFALSSSAVNEEIIVDSLHNSSMNCEAAEGD